MERHDGGPLVRRMCAGEGSQGMMVHADMLPIGRGPRRYYCFDESQRYGTWSATHGGVVDAGVGVRDLHGYNCSPGEEPLQMALGVLPVGLMREGQGC